MVGELLLQELLLLSCKNERPRQAAKEKTKFAEYVVVVSKQL